MPENRFKYQSCINLLLQARSLQRFASFHAPTFREQFYQKTSFFVRFTYFSFGQLFLSPIYLCPIAFDISSKICKWPSNSCLCFNILLAEQQSESIAKQLWGHFLGRGAHLTNGQFEGQLVLESGFEKFSLATSRLLT